jgi:hypothetical protein
MEKIMFPLDCPAEIFDTAYELLAGWHCGQACPIYSLLSTGKVHSTDHLTALRIEWQRIEFETGAEDAWQNLQRWLDSLQEDE